MRIGDAAVRQAAAGLLAVNWFIHGCLSIGCFVCSSYNRSEPGCDDRFNTTYIRDTVAANGESYGHVKYYVNPCWGYRKNRDGFFPADHCIKIKGQRFDEHNREHTVTIRTCSLDSGTLTADTEIVRMSHCGNFKLGQLKYSGCVQSCKTDGCNAAPAADLRARHFPLAAVCCAALASLLFRL